MVQRWFVRLMITSPASRSRDTDTPDPTFVRGRFSLERERGITVAGKGGSMLLLTSCIGRGSPLKLDVRAAMTCFTFERTLPSPAVFYCYWRNTDAKSPPKRYMKMDVTVDPSWLVVLSCPPAFTSLTIVRISPLYAAAMIGVESSMKHRFTSALAPTRAEVTSLCVLRIEIISGVESSLLTTFKSLLASTSADTISTHPFSDAM